MTDSASVTFTLPPKEQAIAALKSLEPEMRDDLIDALVDSMFEAHRSGELPPNLTLTLLDWIAHGTFWASPVFHARLEQARNATYL